jgi:poly(hydroxyalkanoate) granule-associated protein
MVEKLKDPVAAGTEELAGKIRESASQIWLAGLGAFAKAQEEGTKIFEALVKEGEAIQERARKEASERIAEFTAQASGRWDKLEQIFEERVTRVLHNLNVPSKQDIETLNKRVVQLTAAAEKISAGGGKRAHAAKMPTERAYQAKKPKAKRSR